MICPICDSDFVGASGKQLEIQYCPDCQNIMMNHTEIERFIGRTQSRSSKKSKKVTRFQADMISTKQKNKRYKQERKQKSAYYDELSAYD